MKKIVLVTGLSGMVGNRIRELMSKDYDLIDLSLKSGTDITDEDQIKKVVESSEANTILHMAAKTDVDSCEDDKLLNDEGMAWRVNVIGTENIVSSAQKTGKRVIYISTDFVFDGTKDTYTEKDEPNPVNWYGYTKYLGEDSVLKGSDRNTVLRIAYPYRAHFPEKKDFVRRMLEKISNKEKILALTDHIMTPTFIDDIVLALREFFENEHPGIYHLVGSDSMSVIDAVKKIGEVFQYKVNAEPVTRDIFFKDRAFRPFKLALKNDKIRNLAIKMNSFEEGLRVMKKQMNTRDFLL